MSKRALIFLLDRSGSMKDIKDSTIENYNGYLAKMKEVEGLEYTLVQFDTVGTDTVHRRIPIKDVPEMGSADLQPRGGTPLIDAACITLHVAIDKYAQTDKVVFTILTDGLENASKEFKMADLHDLVKTVTGWGWEVTFLGASIDAYKDSGQAGIGAGKVMSYNAQNKEASAHAFRSLAGATQSYFMENSAIDISAEDKLRAGDTFFKPADKGTGDKIKSLIDKANL